MKVAYPLIIMSVLAATSSVMTRDHHINEDNLQELIEEDFTNPHQGSFKLRGNFRNSQGDSENVQNGFFSGKNVLPRPPGFTSLAEFEFPPLPSDSEFDFPDEEYPQFNYDDSTEYDYLLTVDPDAPHFEETDSTTPNKPPTSLSLTNNTAQPDEAFQRPGIRRPVRLPINRPRPNRRPNRQRQRGMPPGRGNGFSGQRHRDLPPGRGIGFSGKRQRDAPPGRGNGGRGPIREGIVTDFKRGNAGHVNEPGVLGFMKSVRRLVRTYI